MGNKIIEALIDSSISVSLIREDVSKGIIEPLGLSKDIAVLFGFGKELMWKGVVVIYMDDLIIPAKDEKEGLEKLKEVLEVASKYGLEMKLKNVNSYEEKWNFWVTSSKMGQYVLQLQK
ncbi:hypothetical protein TNCV_3471021 [Trichonephila clavipes]|nr:hypothetical protein TNCV_3471021 [Trichonephila clavipes]